MDSRIGQIVSTIDVATEGIRSISRMEDLITRALNVSSRPAELCALLRQALQVGVDAREMLTFEKEEAAREMQQIEAR